MDKLFNLVSIQPIVNSQDIISQWMYYEGMITKYLEHSTKNDATTFITLPEYGLGNKLNYNEADLEKVQELVTQFAQSKQVNIVAGSHAHYEEQMWFNRAWLFEAESSKIHEYDKKHLFNYELKNGITPGKTRGTFSISGLKVKLMICSDLWFPEEIRANLHEKIDLLIVPAMAVVQNEHFANYGKTLWHSLAQTRSKENIIPLMVSDWAEQPVREAYTCGSSCIINPSQRWTTEQEKKNFFNFVENEGYIFSTISHESILEYRKYRKDVGLLPDFI